MEGAPISGNPQGAHYVGDVAVTGFNLVNCHFEGGPPQYVQVDAGCYWSGGSVVGCTFGSLASSLPSPTSAGTGGLGARRSKADASAPRTAKAAPGPTTAGQAPAKQLKVPSRVPAPTKVAGGQLRAATTTGSKGIEPAVLYLGCIFRIEGTVSGVAVTGCASIETAASADVVWIITDAANVTRTADSFNSWAQGTLASGSHAGHLVWMGGDSSGQLTIGGDQVCLDATKLGFFEHEPGERGDPFVVRGLQVAGDRNLTSGAAKLVLAQLLIDLAELGLIQRKRIA